MQHIRFGETHEQENKTAALKAKNQTISNRNTREEENNIDNNNKMKKQHIPFPKPFQPRFLAWWRSERATGELWRVDEQRACVVSNSSVCSLQAHWLSYLEQPTQIQAQHFLKSPSRKRKQYFFSEGCSSSERWFSFLFFSFSHKIDTNKEWHFRGIRRSKGKWKYTVKSASETATRPLAADCPKYENGTILASSAMTVPYRMP